MSGDTVQLLLERAVFPLMVALVVWFITKRRSDRATIAKLTAETTKAAADGRVSEGTVHAAIELADVGTLQAHVTAMSAAFKEERESLTRRLDEADQKLAATGLDLERAHAVIDDLRQDQMIAHREMLDLQRRDQHHAQMLEAVARWMTQLAQTNPDIEPPPLITPLAPLLVNEGITAPPHPHRRWSDPPVEDEPVTRQD